jgi:GT2 family glycosyltransferase
MSLAATEFPPAPLTASARPAAFRPCLRTGPRLSVVIVNYLAWHDTANLVRQLRTSACLRSGEAEVVVIDNHSPNHPLVPRLRRMQGLSLRRWRRNRGFARAVNEGCRLSRGDWVLLLNPDMTLDPAFLDEVLDRADRLSAADPAAGIVGFRLRNPDGSRQLSTGQFPTLSGTLGRLLLPRWRRKYDIPPAGWRSQVDWVTGCCLMVRRVCWDRLGGFDPQFFLYYEDVDLCRRAGAAGWTVWFEPAPSAIHHHPLHGRPVPAHLRVITRHALLSYARKHWSNWQFRALAWLVRAEAWLRQLWCHRAGDADALQAFANLGAIAADLAGGRRRAAGARLQRMVRQEEYRRAAPALYRDPQPQPARPPAYLPVRCDAARAS